LTTKAGVLDAAKERQSTHEPRIGEYRDRAALGNRFE
jgi:hypothetical protein